LPELASNISGSCVIGVHVFFKGNFRKDPNQIGENFDEKKNDKTNFNRIGFDIALGCGGYEGRFYRR
jgi:hypothetical protein